MAVTEAENNKRSAKYKGDGHYVSAVGTVFRITIWYQFFNPLPVQIRNIMAAQQTVAPPSKSRSHGRNCLALFSFFSRNKPEPLPIPNRYFDVVMPQPTQIAAGSVHPVANEPAALDLVDIQETIFLKIYFSSPDIVYFLSESGLGHTSAINCSMASH